MIAPDMPNESVKQVIDKFWEAVPPVWNVVRAYIRETATQDFDITVEQFHILRHVNKGICSVSDLASEKQISRPAISQSVDVLVNKGLITRQQDSHDRRFVKLALTDAGASLLTAVFSRSRVWLEEKLSPLPESDLQVVIQGLEILRVSIN